MTSFIIGFITGAWFGIIVISCIVVAKDERRK